MRVPETLPGGYELVHLPGTTAFAVAAAVPWLRGTLAAGVTLSRWAAGQPDAERRTGRGGVSVVRAPLEDTEAACSWAVRHYWRGGAVAAPVLADRYVSLGEPRPFRELAVSHEARRRGISTPAVVAGAVYSAGVVHRADLVTELVPDAVELAQVLFGPGAADREAALAALAEAGRLLRGMAAVGLRHRDLNAKNILLSRSGGAPVAHLLDLDRCSMTGDPLPTGPMRRRLERSLHKFERRTGRALGSDAWAALRDGVGESR